MGWAYLDICLRTQPDKYIFSKCARPGHNFLACVLNVCINWSLMKNRNRPWKLLRCYTSDEEKNLACRYTSREILLTYYTYVEKLNVGRSIEPLIESTPPGPTLRKREKWGLYFTYKAQGQAWTHFFFKPMAKCRVVLGQYLVGIGILKIFPIKVDSTITFIIW